MTTLEIAEAETRYRALLECVPLRPIRNARDYAATVAALNDILDAGGADEDHALADLAEMVGGLIEVYEVREHAPPHVGPEAVLRFLMEQHGLRQSDLPEIGSQGIVSEVLNGKRELNRRQIAELADRFGVSPAAFF